MLECSRAGSSWLNQEFEQNGFFCSKELDNGYQQGDYSESDFSVLSWAPIEMNRVSFASEGECSSYSDVIVVIYLQGIKNECETAF